VIENQTYIFYFISLLLFSFLFKIPFLSFFFRQFELCK